MFYTETPNLGDLALRAAAKYRKRTAFGIYREGGIYARLSYGEFGVLIRQFAALLTSLGVRPGDRVMLLSENRPEWPAAYFAIALAGAVIVPVLVDFIPGQIRTIAEHSGAVVFCVSERSAGKIAALENLSPVPRIFIDSIEDGTILVSLSGKEKRLPLRQFSPLSKGEVPPAGLKPSGAQEGDSAAIIYTSGTTGNSKAVMLSHRNLLFTARASRSLMKIYFRDRLLSVLPLAHTYECTLGLLTAMMSGASITYLDKPPSPAVLLSAIQSLRPTAMVTVPLFIEKICRNLIFPGLEKNPLRRFPPARFLAEQIAGYKLASAFGGALRFFGVGGAPLAEDVEGFLRRVKFPYSPGYGLTECSPLVTGNAPYHTPFRSSGRAIKGIEVRVVPLGKAGEGPEHEANRDGEIQIRGPNVMLGYYRDEDLTRASFTPDGWLKTGDLGYLDRKGNLFIRGRLKVLLLGPSGENIYPEEIESLCLLSSDLVEEVLVQAGDRGVLTALIVLSEKGKALGMGEDQLEELKARVNLRLHPFSRLGRVEVREEPFPKTAMGKIKRQ